MSAENTEKVLDVVKNFIQPNIHLLGMERIHRRVFDEKQDFTRWDQVEKYYSEEIDWDDKLVSEFVIRAKQIVEDTVERVPETYFNIVEPEDCSLETVTDYLDEVPYDKEGEGDRDGFQYNVQDGEVFGRYIYANVNTDLDFSGDVEHFVQEHSVRFRIIPDKRLLIIEDSGVVPVQKGRAAFKKKSNFAVTVCGSLTLVPEEAPEKMEDFLASFSTDSDDHENEPVRYNTDNIKLHNPDASSSGDIKKIELDGDDIRGHDLIQERIDEDGYIIKGLTTRVNYKNSFFNVTVMGGEQMAYAKVEDIGDLEKGKELMAEIRDRYMTHFREF